MNVREYIKSNITFLDGGMGTLLQARGLKPGERPEMWNLTHAEDIIDIQRSYYDAGTNIVNTNTFGANLLHFSEEELENVVKAAIANAREAAGRSSGQQEKFVALDIGPLGKLLKPFGDFEFEEAVEIFAHTVRIGVKCGVDLIMIETMNECYETKAALLAAKENSDLPVFVSNAYGEDGKLMTGASPAAMVAMLEGMGADAIGINCSYGPKVLKPIIEEYIKYASVPVLFKPNAGLPKCVEGRTVFDVGPDEFAEDVAELISNGVRIAGGCCGTTPDHIRMLVDNAKNIKPLPLTEKNYSMVSSYTHAVLIGKSPVLIGERINPTGKKRFKQALIENDTDYILNEGISQQEKGVHILDVNVGLPNIDEPEMLQKVTYELQAVCDLPLQIDTSDPVAMEKALREYNGKAMINSVNGKEESMAAVFPLVKKYGGLVVALTLDEDGIPETAEGRVNIAERIIKRAEEYGIKKKDLIFDTLAMTISADTKAALVTLDSLETIKKNLNCNTSLGVSNVSFGLPARDNVTATFFALALERGLSAAIMNPYSYDMMKVYYAYRALHDLDGNCMDYIEFSTTVVPQAAVSGATVSKQAESTTEDQNSPLQKTIIKGLKEQAKMLTIELLKEKEPLSVVQDEIIPALDYVGQRFEKKIMFLPQLLMSAEAAQKAFEAIKDHMNAEGSSGPTKGKIVIATVQGDIHDIGKNIVKLLLENYGFEVTDLGKDVPPEEIVKETIKQHAPMVGLSALMTTTVPAMEETIKQLRKDAPWAKVIVGGAVLNQEYADRIGADKYSKDAMETVRYCEQIDNE